MNWKSLSISVQGIVVPARALINIGHVEQPDRFVLPAHFNVDTRGLFVIFARPINVPEAQEKISHIIECLLPARQIADLSINGKGTPPLILRLPVAPKVLQVDRVV